MVRDVACVSSFAEALPRCCLESDDLSVTAAVIDVCVFFFFSSIDRAGQVLQFSEEKSPPASCCTCFKHRTSLQTRGGGWGV